MKINTDLFAHIENKTNKSLESPSVGIYNIFFAALSKPTNENCLIKNQFSQEK